MKKIEQIITNTFLEQEIVSGAGIVSHKSVFTPSYEQPQAFNFQTLKRALHLKLQAVFNSKKSCPRCSNAVIKDNVKLKRLSYFCTNCQLLFQK